MKLFLVLFALESIGAADPLGDSIIYRAVQGLATLGILGLVYKIAVTNERVHKELKDGAKAFNKLTFRANDHSKRLFELDGKQEEPFNEFE